MVKDKLIQKAGLATLIASSALNVNADQAYVKFNHSNSSFNQPISKMWRTQNATAGFDNLYDSDFLGQSSDTTYIDFYSETSIIDHEKLNTDARGSQDLSTHTNKVEVRGLGAGTLNANLSFNVNTNLPVAGENIFTDKNLFADVYNVTNGVNADLLGTYDMKQMATNGQTVPITLTDGHCFNILYRIEPINVPPIADPLTITSARNVTNDFSFPVSSANIGDNLNVEMLSSLAGVVFTSFGINGTVRQTTNTPISGNVSYRVNGNGGSATNTLSINYTNTPAVLGNISIEGVRNRALTNSIPGSDSDGDGLTYSVLSMPTNFNSSVVGGNLILTPLTAAPVTNDLITLEADDGFNGRTTNSYAINTNFGQAPSILNGNIAHNIRKGESITNSFSVDNPMGGDLVAIVNGGNPRLNMDGTNYIYSGDAVPGNDSYTVSFSNGFEISNPINLDVTRTNSAPVLSDMNISGDKGISITNSIPGSDPDSDILNYTITQNNLGMESSIFEGNLILTPTNNAPVSGNLRIVGNDGFGEFVTNNVNVNTINTRPTLENLVLFGNKVDLMPTNMVAYDFNRDDLTLKVLNGDTNKLSLNGTNLVYNPSNTVSTNIYTVVVNDGFEDSDPANLIFVTYNRAPVLSDIFTELSSLEQIVGTFPATDPDNDPLSFSILNQPEHGSLSLTNGNQFAFDPHGYVGTNYANAVVSDGSGGSDTNMIELISTYTAVPVLNPSFITRLERIGGGTNKLSFNASPGYNHKVYASTNLNSEFESTGYSVNLPFVGDTNMVSTNIVFPAGSREITTFGPTDPVEPKMEFYNVGSYNLSE